MRSDSILRLGSDHYPPAIVIEWVRVVNPGLYVDAMGRGEVFFIATGIVAERALVLGFSSDYVISGTMHGTSAYVCTPSCSTASCWLEVLALAESFGRARGATAVQIEASLGAIEFYQRHGFVETARGDVALPSGFAMPCVFMRKELC